MRVVIMGCGRTGSILALLLSKAGHKVVVIDKDLYAFQRLGKHHTCQVIVGDGLDQDVLKRADISSADAFISCTKGDNTNLMVVQIARELFGVSRIGAKVNDPVRADAYRKQGIMTVTPGTLTAGLFRDWLLDREPHEINDYNCFYPELEDLMKE